MKPTTQTLILNMAGQDETILNAVESYRARLLNFIRSRVKETSDAEDILQDVFYELTSTYRVLQPVEQMAAWLFRVARNKITDRYRKHKPVLYDDLNKNSENDEQDNFLEEILGSGLDPNFSNLDNQLIREAILEALEQLPASQRDIFIQHELEGRSFVDISEEQGIPVNTLLSRKHYAVKFLRKRLSKLYNELFTDNE